MSKCLSSSKENFFELIFAVDIKTDYNVHTYIMGVLVPIFFGTYFSQRLTMFAVEKNRSRKKSVTKRPIIYVCKLKYGLPTFVMELFFVLKKSAY